MVKIEDHDGDGGVNAGVGPPRNFILDPPPSVVKEEEGQPSSSSSYLRSQFIGMGFPPMLVDSVLQKHGDIDSDTILESLLSHSALHKSGSDSSSSLGGLFDSDNEENNSTLESRKEGNQDIKVEPESFSEKRSYLVRIMNFSQREVDLAFNQLGKEAPLEQLIDCIVIAQNAGLSVGKENGDSTNEGKDESLYQLADKTLYLLQMGFTEEEVSSAIARYGEESTVTVQELADSIFASRYASNIEQKEVKIEPDFLDEAELEHSMFHPSHSSMRYYDDNEDNDNSRIKRPKHIFMDENRASSSRTGTHSSLSSWSVKEELDALTSGPRANVSGTLANPPYFFYGNVVEVPKGTWRQLSDFLFTVEPEFVNSWFFSALMRKEGYIHNLPTERRRVVIPKSPMTIEDALPFTKKWWPSWDTRKQISGVTVESTGIEEICENIGKMIRNSRGVLSQEKQMHIAHQCKVSNLIWVGPDRLSPLEPHQMERILGYPQNHTSLFGLNPLDRIAAMQYAFQTDTVAYLLSPLKDIYPDGLRLLSIYSGIGGAEVALHRLGIPLKCVVSVEESDINRKILRRWWGKTGQTGELIQRFISIWKLNSHALEDLVREFGGFDLVIGGNYRSCRGGTTISTSMGMESNLFFEYVRVVQRVRDTVAGGR